MRQIDNQIISEITESHSPIKSFQIKTKINNLPISKKRLTMLSLLGNDRDLFKEIMDTFKMSVGSRMDSIDIAIERIRKYIAVSELEKKKFGEVFTPINLVVEMLSTLPKEVWTNSNLKWFDNSAGTGVFQFIVIKKLMNGLSEVFPDENLRYRHIVENMIYTCELQVKNTFLYMVAVDPKSEFNLNIYRGSFLSDGFHTHMKNVWGLESFDIIVGNPPYQEQKEGFTKTQPLWHTFIQKSFDILKKDGYITTVHPSGWRNVAGVFKSTQELLKSKEMIFLKLHSFRRGQEVFNAAITFDYYTIRNKENTGLLTKIVFEDEKEFDVDISKLEFIPNESFDEVSRLIAKDGEEKVKIIGDSSYHTQHLDYMSKLQSAKNEYPCVYTVKSPDKGNVPTFWYSSKKTNHFGIPKVIWANGASGVSVDIDGEYGLTQFAYAIVDDVENLENIKKAMQSERFIRNIMGFKHSLGDKYNRKIIATFRKDFWKEFVNEKECVYSKKSNKK